MCSLLWWLWGATQHLSPCLTLAASLPCQAALDHVLDVVAVVGASAVLQDDDQSARVRTPSRSHPLLHGGASIELPAPGLARPAFRLLPDGSA